jgi:pilus assembly protein CpaE
MTELWLGYADRPDRKELHAALRRIAPGAALILADSPQDLRQRLHDEEPGTMGVIVGHSAEGVSEVNLAAALAHDATAAEVVLVARDASGSLRSRARRAGIARVEDAALYPQIGRGQSARRIVLDGLPEMGDDPSVTKTGSPSALEEQRKEAPGVTGGAQSPAALGLSRGISHEGGPIITLVSGRGGVGKTALVALLGSVGATWGMDVALVDLDLSCGNLHACFGVSKPADLARIAAAGTVSGESMARASVHCSEHVRLWGPCERPEMAELVMPHVTELLTHLATQHSLVIVDTSTTFTDAVAQAAQVCDRLLVVHDEGTGALAAASRMSALAVRLGVARTRIVRVANLSDPHARHNAFEGRGAPGLETARIHRVRDGGLEAEELLASGRVHDLVAGGSALVVDVASLLAQTLGDLGCLPDSEAAHKAVQQQAPRRRMFFGRHKEVA